MTEINETEHLEKTIIDIANMLVEERNNLEVLAKKYMKDEETYGAILRMAEESVIKLENGLKTPYFARINFIDNDNDEEDIYIGKNAIIDDLGDPIIVDWRAPISALYYDSEVGECSYVAPQGTINGRLNLKRQYEVIDGKLISYYDVNIVSTDDLLQKYLNDNNNSRIKNIISTIQKEQNTVIRKTIYENLIIQGVAGSGKTTVALHRIAYLVYNYRQDIKTNQYMIIGPNKVFLKYIKKVLPDLDVHGVHQLTYEEFASDYVNEKFEIIDSSEKINNNILGKIDNDIDNFKCSLKYKNMLKEFLKDYINDIIKEDLYIYDYKIFSKTFLQDLFKEVNKNYDNLDLIIEKMSLFLTKRILDYKEKYIIRYNDQTHENFSKLESEELKDEYRHNSTKIREEINRGGKNSIKRYFDSIKIGSIKIYIKFLENIDSYNKENYQYIDTLKEETLNLLKKNQVEYEDLAALMYIKKTTENNPYTNSIRHTVIDEAQDLGEFNFYIIKEIFKNSTFSIFGDLAQSIYDYRGISNWNSLNKDVFNNKSEIIEFNKSYRTTNEIMTVANKIAEHIGLNSSELVIRHKEEVKFVKLDNKDKTTYIIDRINHYINLGYKTIAIISKTKEQSKQLNLELQNNNYDIPNIEMDDDLTNEQYNICTISNQLVKGLEFDVVIVNDVDEENYSSQKQLDMKLLYVACTRALHEMEIIYTKNLTAPIAK